MLDDIKKTLWATADKLRANMDAAEYKHLVLGLIFVKYISDTFATRQAELTRRLTDPADEYFFHDAQPPYMCAARYQRVCKKCHRSVAFFDGVSTSRPSSAAFKGYWLVITARLGSFR